MRTQYPHKKKNKRPHKKSQKNIQQKKAQTPTQLDRLAVIVYTDSEPILLTQKDLERPDLSGRKLSHEEIITTALICYDALNYYKIPAPTEAVEKRLAHIKEENHLTDAQLSDLFKESGYTFEEGKAKLVEMYAVQGLLDNVIRVYVIISDEEVRTYYDTHPLAKHASYRVQKGFIPSPDLGIDEINAALSKDKDSLYVEWSPAYWIDEDEISDESPITKLTIGTHSTPEKIDKGWAVTKLIEKREGKILSLEERYRDISEILSMPKYEKLLK